MSFRLIKAMLQYTSGKGIQPVIPGLVNTQGVNNPLITFESLVDTDFGLLLYIDKCFLDPSVFDIEVFNTHHKIKQMIWCLMNREKWNPLYLFMRKDLKAPEEIADELYNEFMNINGVHFRKILDLSMLTNLCDFLQMTEAGGRDITTTVVCRTEYEQDFVNKKISQSSKTILYDKITGKSDEYQQFFFRHLEDPWLQSAILNSDRKISDFTGINKTIYMADYKFNNVYDLDSMKEDSPLRELSSKPNQIKIYSPYDKVLYKEREETNNG